MKTKYSPLVQVKKNIMQKSERILQSANQEFQRVKKELEISQEALFNLNTPLSGKISELLSSKTLLESQRRLIEYNKLLVMQAQTKTEDAKNQLKLDMIEYEKYNYLDLQELKKYEELKKLQEAKDLDEIALMIFAKTARNDKENI